MGFRRPNVAEDVQISSDNFLMRMIIFWSVTQPTRYKRVDCENLNCDIDVFAPQT